MTQTLSQDATRTAVPTTTPIKVRRLGHIVYYVSDVERSVQFWTEIMGFKLSDRNERGMAFLRCGSDHHTIALTPKDSTTRLPADAPDVQGTMHFAFEVGSVEELFQARDFAKSRGYEVIDEGRKGPGSNVEIHILDPDGYDIELYADMDQIGWDGQSRPSSEWRRVKSLEEAVANPVPSRG